LKNEVDTEARAIIEGAAPILLAISAKSEEEQDWRSDLVGNTVCADLLAYITTDAAWTGIEKRPGYYRVYDYFVRANKPLSDGTYQERLCIRLTKGGLRTDIVSAILDLLDMRYALTERVLFHHAKAIASAMLARAARLVELQDDPVLLTMGDEMFLNYLEGQACQLSDRIAADGASMLLKHLRSRRLYKRIFKIQRQVMDEWDRSNSKTDADSFCTRWRAPKAIEHLLSTIEDRFSLPRGSLVLWCPEVKSGMKLAKVNVVWEQSGGWRIPVELRSEQVQRQFPGVHNRVETIEKQYLDLWTFWVGIHPEQISKSPAVVDALSSELGIACDPVFIETYAKTRLAGFAPAANLYGKLDGTWRTQVMPAVSQQLLNIAARPGTEVDASVVTEAIHDVSGKRRPSTKKQAEKKKPEQPTLPKIGELSEEERKE
jgi:hypothetical protein